MLEGLQFLLPWSLKSNVKLSWMLVNGHFCQRCHVRWFLTAYWHVRARVDAKCSFFPPRLLWWSIQTIIIHFFTSASQSPVHPSAVVGRWPRPTIWAIIGANGRTNQTNPTRAKALRKESGSCGDLFPSTYLIWGCFTIASTCFTESGSKTQNG